MFIYIIYEDTHSYLGYIDLPYNLCNLCVFLLILLLLSVFK